MDKEPLSLSEDSPFRDCEITFPWLQHPKLGMVPVLRLHKDGKPEGDDIVVPLDRHNVLYLGTSLAALYKTLTALED